MNNEQWWRIEYGGQWTMVDNSQWWKLDNVGQWTMTMTILDNVHW